MPIRGRKNCRQKSPACSAKLLSGFHLYIGRGVRASATVVACCEIDPYCSHHHNDIRASQASESQQRWFSAVIMLSLNDY